MIYVQKTQNFGSFGVKLVKPIQRYHFHQCFHENWISQSTILKMLAAHLFPKIWHSLHPLWGSLGYSYDKNKFHCSDSVEIFRSCIFIASQRLGAIVLCTKLHKFDILYAIDVGAIHKVDLRYMRDYDQKQNEHPAMSWTAAKVACKMHHRRKSLPLR